MESTRWRNCVDLQWYMDSLLQFAGYLDTPLRMSTRSYISSEEVFSSLNNSDSRPSNFLFQIARGSGATLSECTFSSKKPTSLRRLLQDRPLQGFKTRTTSSLFQIARDSGATPRWEYFFFKKAHTTRRS